MKQQPTYQIYKKSNLYFLFTPDTRRQSRKRKKRMPIMEILSRVDQSSWDLVLWVVVMLSRAFPQYQLK